MYNLQQLRKTYANHPHYITPVFGSMTIHSNQGFGEPKSHENRMKFVLLNIDGALLKSSNKIFIKKLVMIFFVDEFRLIMQSIFVLPWGKKGGEFLGGGEFFGRTR